MTYNPTDDAQTLDAIPRYRPNENRLHNFATFLGLTGLAPNPINVPQGQQLSHFNEMPQQPVATTNTINNFNAPNDLDLL